MEHSGGHQEGCQADETIAARTGTIPRPSNGLSYKQRTKKVINAIAMTANWKKDVDLEDDEIRQRIVEENRTVCRDDEKLEGQKIRRYTVQYTSTRKQ